VNKSNVYFNRGGFIIREQTVLTDMLTNSSFVHSF